MQINECRAAPRVTRSRNVHLPCDTDLVGSTNLPMLLKSAATDLAVVSLTSTPDAFCATPALRDAQNLKLSNVTKEAV
jgi:hypothetical protein